MTTYSNPWALLLHRHFQMMSSQLLLLLLEIFISPPRHSLAFFDTEFHSIAITSVLKAHPCFSGWFFFFVFFCMISRSVSVLPMSPKPASPAGLDILSLPSNQDYSGHCVAPQEPTPHLALSLSTPHSSLPSSKPQFKAHWVKPTCPIS